jgi:hypothetical protein
MIFVRRDANLIPPRLLNKAIEAQRKLEQLPESQRKFFIKRNAHIWRAFGSYLSKMSHGKCWYSESPDPQSFFDVDHFRPKSEARRTSTHVDRPGYTWLAFDWDNFRYSANRSNRVTKTGKLKLEGKGSWFPLMTETKATWSNRCVAQERPALIDPTKKQDVRLIEVKDDGRIGPSKYAIGSAIQRVTRSCEIYGLNLPAIKGARLTLAREVRDLVEVLLKTIEAANSPQMPTVAADALPVDDQIEILRKKTLPGAPYARAVRCELVRAGCGDLCGKPEEA